MKKKNGEKEMETKVTKRRAKQLQEMQQDNI